MSGESRSSSVNAQLMRENVWVVIPARNEEKSLPLVLADLPLVDRIIVVNNGSTDRTAEVATQCCATVVDEVRPGYGQACLTGLAKIESLVEERGQEPGIVVFIDADYSDYPEDLDKLILPIVREEADFVLGSRLAGKQESGAMPLQSRYGNRLAVWLIRKVWRVRYTDLGPFRAITYSALRSLQMSDQDYGWTVEMQIKAAMAGLRIEEISVRYRRRIGVSKISGTLRGTILAGSKILWTIGRYAWMTRHWQPATPVKSIPANRLNLQD